MRLLSLFSGVGALDAAVERAFGATVVAHCEADAYCRQILARHWPGVPCFTDVRTLTAAGVGQIDCICGGSPCQDMSAAGKQVGITGPKSGLWFEYLRLVRELRPSIVVIENVPPLYRTLEWRLQVENPLVTLGYRVIWTLARASDVGAPHRRERTFALAVLPGVRVPMVQGLPSSHAAVASWPTPAAMIPNDGEGLATFKARQAQLKAKHGNGNGCGTPLTIAMQGGNDGEYLLGAVQAWASPANRDHRSGKGRTENGHTPQLPEQVAGLLNAAWVEPLMGMPIGWTEAEGEPQQIDFAPAWPMGRGLRQHAWEPPRTIAPKIDKCRRKRMMALGNAVVPQQAMLALGQLAATANDSTRNAFGRAQMELL